MTTIQDVARLAGVSVSSVSNVLNGRSDRMRQDTFARIDGAIRKLDYRPSQAARQLKTGRTPILGLLVPTAANPSFGQLAVAMENFAQERYGYRVLLCNTYRDKQLESRMLDDLIDFGVGAVVVVSSLSDERHIEAAIERGLAVVSFDLGVEPDAQIRNDHVLADNRLAGRLAAMHLIEHGHKRLAFLVPRGQTMSRRHKVEGFLAAAEEAGSGVSAEIIESDTLSKFGDTELCLLGFESAEKILQMKRRPTGVATVNDMTAIGLMAGIRRHGLSVPEDISVVGMDDLVMSAYVWPPLTSVSMPVTEMAQKMVDRAIQHINTPGLRPEQITFAPHLVSRQSVGAPPGARKPAQRNHAKQS
ncbi:MAG: LacI family DNA-binding transcriptional regulator [Pollutimonas bauzanensis]